MSAVIKAESLLGTWRRFGQAGPVYEIIGAGKPKTGHQTMRIRVVESGEEIDLKLSDILADPLES